MTCNPSVLERTSCFLIFISAAECPQCFISFLPLSVVWVFSFASRSSVSQRLHSSGAGKDRSGSGCQWLYRLLWRIRSLQLQLPVLFISASLTVTVHCDLYLRVTSLLPLYLTWGLLSHCIMPSKNNSNAFLWFVLMALPCISLRGANRNIYWRNRPNADPPPPPTHTQHPHLHVPHNPDVPGSEAGKTLSGRDLNHSVFLASCPFCLICLRGPLLCIYIGQ